MAGRNFISVSNVQKGSRASKLEGDWATIGVIVNKSDVRKSSKVDSLPCVPPTFEIQMHL